MRFSVAFRTGTSASVRTYPSATLEQDNWDDYGFKSMFNVVLHLSKSKSVDLGNIRIIQNDLDKGYTEMPRRSFTQLPPTHASLGADIEYYQKLHSLGESIYKPFLDGLRDVAFSSDARISVRNTEAYRVSLLRFGGAESTIEEAMRLFRMNRSRLKRRGSGFRMWFNTQIARDSNEFVTKFDFRRRGRLPNRINALIGYNGTGKTRLLSNLAIVASGYGYSTRSDALTNAAGNFVGNSPPFKAVVVVSYSAFDTFVIPGRTRVERARLKKEGGELFGYVYCGLRLRSEETDESGELSYRLRTPGESEREFIRAFRRVKDSGRLKNLLKALKPLLLDPSFRRIGLSDVFQEASNARLASIFRELSSGHKVVLKIITELTAHISDTDPTLVLIDEPETHLHPPLLAAFLKSVKSCLDMFDGYAVIATHSPVVLQETPARYVHVLRRTIHTNRTEQVDIETFGESVGVITQEVFNLGDGATEWQNTLKELATRYELDDIEQMFSRKLGFSARSYVLSIQDEDDLEADE
jgi:hypothetical protein